MFCYAGDSAQSMNMEKPSSERRIKSRLLVSSRIPSSQSSVVNALQEVQGVVRFSFDVMFVCFRAPFHRYGYGSKWHENF